MALLTREQADRIIGVIRSDAKVKDKYVTETGDNCVIGGLAVAAGVPLPAGPVTSGADYDLNEMRISAITLRDFAQEIAAAYGLPRIDGDQWTDPTMLFLRRLQRTNDAYDTVELRREQLIQEVEENVDTPTTA